MRCIFTEFTNLFCLISNSFFTVISCSSHKLCIQIPKNMSLSPPQTQHISLQRVTINLKFPCKVFLVVTVIAQGRELTKMQTRSVELINNEASFEQSFSVDTGIEKRKALQIQYSLYIETKNGVKMAGKASDSFTPDGQKIERVLQFEKCPDKDAAVKVSYHCDEMLDRSKVTIIPNEYGYQTRIKALIADKSRLESQLSLIELENYEKDILIKNLTLELRLKAEENKYLFTAEKLKEVSNGYQVEIRDLKKKHLQGENEIKALKRQIEHLKRELEIANKQKHQARNSNFAALGKALQRMARNLQIHTLIDMIQTPKTDQETDQHHTQQQNLGQTLGKKLNVFQKSVSSLKQRYTESTTRVVDLQKQIKQNQELVKEIGEQLERKRNLSKELEKTVDEQRAEIGTLKSKLQEEGRVETQQLKKVKTQNIELSKTVSDLKKEVQELDAASIRHIEAQTKLKELMQEQQVKYENKISNFVVELQKWKGVEIQSSTVNAEKIKALEEELKYSKEVIGCLQVQKLCLEEQRKQNSSELQRLQQQLQDLQAKLKQEQQSFAAACARSKNCLKQVSNTNISIAESYSRLRIESQYRLNEEKSEKALLKIELDQIKSRYQSDIQDLKRKLQELGSIEKQTMNLCHRLGYSEPDENDLSAFVCDSETKMPRPEDHARVSREGESNKLRKQYDRLQSSLSQVAWPTNRL